MTLLRVVTLQHPTSPVTTSFAVAVMKLKLPVALLDYWCVTLLLFNKLHFNDMFRPYKLIIRWILLSNCCTVLLSVVQCFKTSLKLVHIIFLILFHLVKTYKREKIYILTNFNRIQQ
jgi:hypothetical protein